MCAPVQHCFCKAVAHIGETCGLTAVPHSVCPSLEGMHRSYGWHAPDRSEGVATPPSAHRRRPQPCNSAGSPHNGRQIAIANSFRPRSDRSHSDHKVTNMKRLALLAAGLLLFSGCGRDQQPIKQPVKSTDAPKAPDSPDAPDAPGEPEPVFLGQPLSHWVGQKIGRASCRERV